MKNSVWILDLNFVYQLRLKLTVISKKRWAVFRLHWSRSKYHFQSPIPYGALYNTIKLSEIIARYLYQPRRADSRIEKGEYYPRAAWLTCAHKPDASNAVSLRSVAGPAAAAARRSVTPRAKDREISRTGVREWMHSMAAPAPRPYHIRTGVNCKIDYH